ncbi:hypothetical protein [Mycobacterium marinum]
MLANFALEVVAIGVADELPNYLDIGAEAKRAAFLAPDACAGAT